MKRVVAVAALAAMTIASAGTAVAKDGGKSANARKCQQNGWKTLMAANGTTFDNEQQCVSFAAQGGALVPLQRPPVANNDTANTNEDTAVTIDVLANDTDPDGHTLTVTAAERARAATFADGTLIYTPAANFNGPDTFTYTISDGQGGTATATVTVTVNPVNDLPWPATTRRRHHEDTPVTIAVLANDTDVDGNALTSRVTPAAWRGGPNADGTLTYTPAADFNGTDTFTYTISDGTGGRTATVTVTVNPVNDAARRHRQHRTAPTRTPRRHGPRRAGQRQRRRRRRPDGVLVGERGQRHVTLDPTARAPTHPAANFNGTDTSPTRQRRHGGIEPGHRHSHRHPVNDPPVANDDAAATDEDTAVTSTCRPTTPTSTDTADDHRVTSRVYGPSRSTPTGRHLHAAVRLQRHGHLHLHGQRRQRRDRYGDGDRDGRPHQQRPTGRR